MGYWLIGMPYALCSLALWLVFNIIPYLGPFLERLPRLIMASTISLKMLLFVLLVNLAVQILKGNVISPQVVGKNASYASVIYHFRLIVGGEVAGILGLILAVPFFAVMKVIIQQFSFTTYISPRHVGFIQLGIHHKTLGCS